MDGDGFVGAEISGSGMGDDWDNRSDDELGGRHLVV
jgi:hypothetical protein